MHLQVSEGSDVCKQNYVFIEVQTRHSLRDFVHVILRQPKFSLAVLVKFHVINVAKVQTTQEDRSIIFGVPVYCKNQIWRMVSIIIFLKSDKLLVLMFDVFEI